MELQLFGIPVTIRNSFWMTAGIYLLFGLQGRNPIEYVLVGVFCLFAAVVLHESGHALVATAFRLGPVVIEVHGLGGVTYHRGAREWWKNLLVSLAGPAANLLSAVAAVVGLVVAPFGLLGYTFGQLLFISLFLAILNLLPIFPMDGGKALRSVFHGFGLRDADLWTANIGLVGATLLTALAVWRLVAGGGYGIFSVIIAAQLVMQNWEFRNSALASRR
jgi:Zn-dependent protease